MIFWSLLVVCCVLWNVFACMILIVRKSIHRNDSFDWGLLGTKYTIATKCWPSARIKHYLSLIVSTPWSSRNRSQLIATESSLVTSFIIHHIIHHSSITLAFYLVMLGCMVTDLPYIGSCTPMKKLWDRASVAQILSSGSYSNSFPSKSIPSEPSWGTCDANPNAIRSTYGPL